MAPLLSLLLALLGLPPMPQNRGATPAVARVEGVVVRAGTDEPIVRATVTLTREAPRWLAIDDLDNTAASNSFTAQAMTNDKGRFTIGVPAGRYTLAAGKDGFLPTEYGRRGANALGAVLVVSDKKIEDIVLRLTPAGAIAGYVSSPAGEALAGVSVEVYRLRYTWNGRRLGRVQAVATTDLGEFRLFGLNSGLYYVAADYSQQARRALSASGVRFTANLSNPDEGYALFYFPDATNPYQAQPVRVAPGADSGNVNIALKDTTRYTLRGRVVLLTPSAQIGRIEIGLSPAGILFEPGSSPVRIDANAPGEFQIKAAPGEYVLTATAEAGDIHYSSVDLRVVVTDRDIENIQIPLYSGVNISGRIELDGPRATSDPSGAVIRLVRTTGDGQAANRAIAARDGGFVLSDVTPGDYDVLVTASGGRYVKGISFSGRDGLMTPIRIAPASSSRLVIELSSSGASVDGRATTVSGDLIAGAQIVLIPEDGFRRRQDRYLIAATDASGRFELRSIPPGNYTAFAFEEIEPGAYYDPEFSRRFAGKGMPVRVPQNGRATVEVQIITAAEATGGGR